MVEKFAQRYGEEKPFVAVHLGGITMGVETFFHWSPEMEAQWKALGFRGEDQLIDLYKKWIDFYAKTFPKQRIIIDICHWFNMKEEAKNDKWQSAKKVPPRP